MLFGEKVPVPDEAQLPPVAEEFTEPLKETVALLAQTV